MHIAIIRQYFDKAHGGAEQYAVGLARGLLEAGHRVSVVCCKANAQDADGIGITRVGKGKWAGPWRHTAFAKSAGAAANRLGADAVIALARAYPADFFRLGDPLHRAFLALSHDTPDALRRAARNPKHASLLALEEKLLSPAGAQHFIANSEMVKRQVIHGYGVEPSRVSVIRNPVDRARFNPEVEQAGSDLRLQLGIQPDELVVLFSGMEYRRKGLVQAARVFAAMVREAPALKDKLRFLVVGKGNTAPGRDVLAAAGCADRMVEKPPVRDIERYYGAANLFLLPTLYDPSANAVTEALACGTPVITTRLNGASEMIKPGVNGFVIDSREDTAAWAAAASQLLATERVQRSRGFVAMARRIPDWRGHVEQWEPLLVEHLERKLRKQFAFMRPASRQVAQELRGESLLYRNEAPQARNAAQRADELMGTDIKYTPDMVIGGGGSPFSAYIACDLAPRQHARDPFFALPVASQLQLRHTLDGAQSCTDEFELLADLQAAGLPVPVPVAAQSDGFGSMLAWLVLPGRPLDEFVREALAKAGTARRMVVAGISRALAMALTDLHRAGVTHGGLGHSMPPRVLIKTGLEGGFEAAFNGFADASRHQSNGVVTRQQATDDLAGLHHALPAKLASRTDRLRFVRTYIWESGLAVPRRELLADIAHVAAKWPERDAITKPEFAGSAAAAAKPALVPATKADIDG